ncbi:MAG: hypothetical protein ACI93R_001387 [Flavobacteriales bacterium]|jgi:hypothetical protein
MKAHHYLGIAIRLFSIGLFIYSINQLARFTGSLTYGTADGIEVSAILTGVIYVPWLLASIFLWYFPLTIAKNIIPPEVDIKPTPISSHAALSVCISVISLYFIYNSITDGLYWLMFWNFTMGLEASGVAFTLEPENKANIYTTVIEFLVATILFINAKRVAHIAGKF